MKKALYPGSFDPITIGHIDVIQRAAPLFSEVTLLVSNSSSKKYLFSLDERKKLIEEAQISPNIKIDSYTGLTAEYAKKHGIDVIIRGIRAVSDFEYEMTMANMNKKLNPGLETITIFTEPNLNYISSSLIKEIAKLGGSVESFVSPNVNEALKEKYK